METASGFSPLGLVMPHCGMSCPIKKLNQHLFARAERCRGMTSRCTVPIRQVLPVFVVSKARLLTKKGTHGWEWRLYAFVLDCRLISFQTTVAKMLACTSQCVKWKQSWDFHRFGIHKVEVLRHFGTLPTVPATAAGDFYRRSGDFLIWLNVISAVLPQQGVAEGLTQEKQDSWQSSEQNLVRMTLVRTCCRLISFQTAAAKNFAWEPHWVKWKQSWDFCTFQVHKIEVLRHLRTLPTVTAMSVRDVCRWSVDLVIWLNAINVTEHSSLPSLPTAFAKWLPSSSLCRMETARGYPPRWLGMPHCGMTYLVLNFPINSFNLINIFFARAGRCRGWCHAVFSSQLSN